MGKFKRYRFFLEHRTIRIAIAVTAVLICVTCVYALYLVKANFGRYASQYQENQYLAQANLAFLKDADYASFIGQDRSIIKSERVLFRAEALKPLNFQTLNPLGQSKFSQVLESIQRIDSEPIPAKDKVPAPRPTEEQCDQLANSAEQLIHRLVSYSQSLDISRDFGKKKQVLVVASMIASAMDCRFSYSSYMARTRAEYEISQELLYISGLDIPKQPKVDLTSACLPILMRRFKDVEMLLKEELRILDEFEISIGKRNPDRNTIAYRQPARVSFFTRLLHRLPIVQRALQSNIYETFSIPVHRQIAALGENPNTDNQYCLATIDDLIGQFQKGRLSHDLVSEYEPWLLDETMTSTLHRMKSNIRHLKEQIVE